jgi:predicted 3-demethylubiquinone-9 3-methyltransferase (glyoxalase superfamily)
MSPDNLCIVPMSTWEDVRRSLTCRISCELTLFINLKKQESIDEFLDEMSKDPREVESISAMADAFFESWKD